MLHTLRRISTHLSSGMAPAGKQPSSNNIVSKILTYVDEWKIHILDVVDSWLTL